MKRLGIACLIALLVSANFLLVSKGKKLPGFKEECKSDCMSNSKKGFLSCSKILKTITEEGKKKKIREEPMKCLGATGYPCNVNADCADGWSCEFKSPGDAFDCKFNGKCSGKKTCQGFFGV